VTEAYPLAWPEGWPRTPPAQQVDGRYQFKKVGGDGWRKPYTFTQARDALYAELGRMKAAGLVLSTNFQLNSRGEPRGDRARPADEGIAIYFTRKGRPLVMACDRYNRAEENMNSLRLALEAMRQLERHGGGVLAEKAFTGFAALPAPPRPHEILAIAADAGEAEIRAAWRRLIAEHHPDQGGGHDRAAELNAARDAMLKGRGK
jgi:hypothetical protein